MGDPTRPDGDLEKLLMELMDGELTAAQRRQLRDLLRDDPAACRRYTKGLVLDSLLAWELSDVGKNTWGLPETPGFRVAEEDRPGARRWWARPRRAVAVAAAVVAAALAILAGGVAASRRPGASPPKVAEQAPEGGDRREAGDSDVARAKPKPVVAGNVAVLTRAIDPVWGPTALPTGLGSALPAGRLRLKSGLIQLEFYGGANVVLEGPADFEIIAADRASCRQGKLRVRVPLHSSRFSIVTPNADVIDLGTEFGVQVDERGGSEVQVFEGSVELRSNGRSRAVGRQLSTGEGERIDDSGGSRPIAADPDSFVGMKEMQRRASSDAGRRYDAWLALSRKLQADPRVLVYYSFEGQQPWERTLLDRAVGRGPKRNGGLVGCEWTEGRWPGKSALDFKRTSDRVLVNIPGEFQALTLMTWVRVDYFDNRLNALLLADGWARKKLHWELDGRGILVFAIKDGFICHTPVVLGEDQLGLWTHLAAVYAPKRRSLTTYVNGREVQRFAIPESSRAILGGASIGNYTDPPPTEPADRVIRNLNGRIDEFIIFDHELDAREVREIYEVGKPTP